MTPHDYDRAWHVQFVLSRMHSAERAEAVAAIDRALRQTSKPLRMLLHALRDDLVSEGEYETRTLARLDPDAERWTLFGGQWGDDPDDGTEVLA